MSLRMTAARYESQTACANLAFRFTYQVVKEPVRHWSPVL